MVDVTAPIDSPGKTLSFVANADLSAAQFYLVKLVTGGKVDLCSAATDRAIGVLLNDPISGGEALVGMFGVYSVKHVGVANPGDRLAADSASKAAVTTSAADWTVGIALALTAAGDISPALIGPFGNV